MICGAKCAGGGVCRGSWSHVSDHHYTTGDGTVVYPTLKPRRDIEAARTAAATRNAALCGTDPSWYGR